MNNKDTARLITKLNKQHAEYGKIDFTDLNDLSEMLDGNSKEIDIVALRGLVQINAFLLHDLLTMSKGKECFEQAMQINTVNEVVRKYIR